MYGKVAGAIAAVSVGVGVVALVAQPAAACGGLVAPNGTVHLVRTATLAAYHGGLEHYVTSFRFAGDGAEVGSIVPLPGVPTKVERGGDWTLQRLQRETEPRRFAAASADTAGGSREATVVYQTRIDALDITILKGGPAQVGTWARGHGYLLTPDAPEILRFYASRSPVFMAARFDAQAARQRGEQSGDGTPIHLTIPVRTPWVPLRILTLGLGGPSVVGADVYLLTDRRPALLPAPASDGFTLERSLPANDSLLNDLRSDKGMAWVPQQMWLSHLIVDRQAKDLHFDLAIDASGTGRPSPLAAGLAPPPRPPTTVTVTQPATALTPRTAEAPDAVVPRTVLGARPAGDGGRSAVPVGVGTGVGTAALVAVASWVRRLRRLTRVAGG